MSEYKDFRVAQTFGGVTVFVKTHLFDQGDNIHDLSYEMTIPDGPLLEVVKRGLERLSGQGKVDEQLRSMCYCVGEPR